MGKGNRACVHARATRKRERGNGNEKHNLRNSAECCHTWALWPRPLLLSTLAMYVILC